MDGISRQLLFLSQMLIFEVLVFTKIVGVTHWKLQENSIVPASAASSDPSDDSEADELFWSSVSGEDPEFSVLMKQTTGAGGPLGTGAGGPLGTVAGGTINSGNRNCERNPCLRGQKTPPKENTCAKKPEDCESTLQSSAPRYPDGSGPM